MNRDEGEKRDKTNLVRSDDLALKVLHQTLQSTSDLAIKRVGGFVLSKLLCAAVADPVINMLADIVKSLLSELFKTTSSVGEKIDAIISEPLATAVTTLKEVLSVEITSDTEIQECERQLDIAFDSLRRAYSYAERNDPEKLTLIRMYQSLACALSQKRRPFLEKYIGELKALAADLSQRARALGSVDSSQIEIYEFHLRRYLTANIESDKLATYGWYLDSLYRNGPGKLEEAKRLNQYAAEVDGFCDFVTMVAGVDVLGFP